MDYNLLFAEAWPVELNPGQFRSDEARLRVMARIAGILVDLEAAIRRELGADQITPKTGAPPGTTPDSVAPHDSEARLGAQEGQAAAPRAGAS